MQLKDVLKVRSTCQMSAACYGHESLNDVSVLHKAFEAALMTTTGRCLPTILDADDTLMGKVVHAGCLSRV